MSRLVKQFVKALKALGDENRLKIVKLLLVRKDLCVCELQSLLGLSQPTVSRHLKILEDASFVESRREGQWVIYWLKKQDNFLSPLLRVIDDTLIDDNEIKVLAQKAKEIDLRKCHKDTSILSKD